MKLIPTASQTVGPFFSIGLTSLYQAAVETHSASAITICGTIFDGDRKPIPDAVLEFWSAGGFQRVPTSEDGSFSVIVSRFSARIEKSEQIPTKHLEVLIFMRGLLKAVHTRVYLAHAETLKSDPGLKSVPADRNTTLVAQKTDAPNQYEWNVFMQGADETVFFEY